MRKIGPIYCCKVIPKASGVYRISNCVTGECYIGSTKNLLVRVRGHSSRLMSGCASYKMRESFDAHPNSFYFEIVEMCAVEDLADRELYWINKYEPSLNTVKSTAWIMERKPVSHTANEIVRQVRAALHVA